MNTRTAKILTNDTDANMKVSQNTNINIIPTTTNTANTANTSPPPSENPYLYPSVAPITEAIPKTTSLERLPSNVIDKDKQIKLLELMLECYQQNPLIIDKYVVCASPNLINIIQILTEADKVEINVEPDSCSCFNNKLKLIQKIFITKNNKTKDFKYGYIQKYCYLRDHNISLKITY